MRVRLIKTTLMFVIMFCFFIFFILITCINSNATIIIDKFETYQFISTTENNKPVSSSVGSSGDTTIIGGYRDAKITKTGGGGLLYFIADGPGSTVGDLSEGGSSTGFGQLQWDGNADSSNIGTLDYDGLGGIDITENGNNNAILFGIVWFDDAGGVDANINLTIYDTSNRSATLSLTLTSPITVLTRKALLFTDFLINNPSIDLTSVGAMQLDILPNGPSVDLQFDFIESTYVPEPGTLILLGSGLMGLAGYSKYRYSRRKRSKQADM